MKEAMRLNRYPSQLTMKITASCFIFLLAVFLLFPIFAHAQTAEGNLDLVGAQSGLQKQDLRVLVGRIIKVFLGIIGAVALIIVLYAGFLWMTSGGNAEQRMQAQKWLTNGMIGLIIIFASYSITAFLLNMFSGKQTYAPAGTPYTTAGLPGGGFGLSGGAFGEVIQSHYPLPEQTGVPRNTMILVTFRAPVQPDSIIDFFDKSYCPAGLSADVPCGSLKKSAFRVFTCVDMIKESYGESEKVTCINAQISNIADDSKLVPGFALITEDHRTVIFNPYGAANDHLGSPEFDVPYIVFLTTAIQEDGATGKSIFPKQTDYKWRFTTSTVLDLTPPKINSVIPAKVGYPIENPAGCSCSPKDLGCADVDCAGYVYLNQGIYVNFNEPVIPPLTQTQTCKDALGDGDNEVQMTLKETLPGCQSAHVPGNWKVGINQYRTVQFMSSTECEGGATNSCGEPAFCLPSQANITGKVLAAKILDAGVALPGTGIMDMGGNSLDGNGNGKSDGPGEINADPDKLEALKDNYFWLFITGNKLDLTAPYILGLLPQNKTSELKDPFTRLEAEFNEPLDAYSVDTEVLILGVGADGAPYGGWYDPNLGLKIDPETKEESVVPSKIFITHGPFVEWDSTMEKSPLYTPVVRSEVKDSRFNCFSPTKESGQGAVKESDCWKATQPGGVPEPGWSCCPKANFYNLEGKKTEECPVPEP